MQERLKERSELLRRSQRHNSPLPYFLVFCAIVAALFSYFYSQKTASEALVHPESEPANSARHEISGSQPEKAIESLQAPPFAIATSATITQDASNHTEAQRNTDSVLNAVQPSGLSDDANLTSGGSYSSSALPETATLDSSQHYQTAVANISRFFNQLDNSGHISTPPLPVPSEQYFTALIQKVLDNPPIVTGETDDLFNILKNTAHFFRIVGKDNINHLKTILANEGTAFELVLADYYTLTQRPEYLENEFSLKITDDALYDYAGFFLTTMGGRLYLFRRDSVSRMVVSYYSILIIDEANAEGRNSYGVDIRPAVDNLLSELESSNAEMRLKDRYLDRLYDLKAKYM